MDEKHKKRRTSILKKRPSTEDDPTEITISKFPKKAQFSQKKQVKEFLQCEENLTIWGNTYETSVAKSEGSSDGSSTSRKISVDFSHTTINMTTHETTSMNESCEKENLIVQNSVPKISIEPRSSLNVGSTSNSECSIELTTVDMNVSERKRINNYGIDNLNITNMPLDNSYDNKHLNVAGNKSGKILSPRKMIFIHTNPKLSVTIKDKVFLSPVEIDDNVSVSIEDDESPESMIKTGAIRKTISKPVDMNISVEHEASKVKKEVKIEEKPSTSKHFQVPKIIPSITKTSAPEKSLSLPKFTPTVFKPPEIPKTFNFPSKSYDSPPIKPVVLCNQKEENDELFDMIVSDTPSKLCCLGKAHTPTRSAQKVLFSASRPMSLRKSTDIFKEIGLIDDDEDDKFKRIRKTIFHNDSIKLEVTHKDDRKTTFDGIKMDETIETHNKTQNDGDLDISIEPVSKVHPISPKDDLFTDKMEETCTEQQPNKSTANKSFFEFDDDEASCSVARNVPLMKIKADDFDFVEKSLKRSTLSNDTCNATNFIMQMTNIDDTGGSLETTAEIQRKAAKLLNNPNATLGSSINSPFPQNISEINFKEPSKVHKSLNLESDMTFEDIQKSSASFKNRMTTFDENKMEISGIEPTIEGQNDLPMLRKSQINASVNQSVKNRTTSYNPDQMDISRHINPEHTNTSSLMPPKSYEIHVSPKEMAKLKGKQSAASAKIEEPKKRVTTYNTDNMDLSGCELTNTNQQQEVLRDSVIKSVKSASKIQIYTDESILMQEEVQNKRTTTYKSEMNVSDAAANNKRETCYNFNNMDVTGTEFQNKPSIANLNSPLTEDLTDFVPRNANVHKSIVSQLNFTDNVQAHKSRATSYNIDQMDITNVDNTPEVQIKKQINSRTTIYKTGNMDMSIVETTSHMPVKKSSNNRATTYAVKDITETTSDIPKIKLQESKPTKNRATTYNVNQMDMTLVASTSQQQTNLDHTITSNLRTSVPYQIYVSPKEIAMMNRSLHKSTEESKKRVTTYQTDDMDVTEYEGANLQTQKTREFVVQHVKSQFEVFNDQNMSMELKDDLNDNKHATVANACRATTYNPNDMNVSAEITDKKRMTNFNMDISGIEVTDEFIKKFSVNEAKSVTNNANINPEKSQEVKNRATTYNVNAMDMSNAETSFNIPEHTITSNLRVQKQYEIHVSPKELAKANKANRSNANHSKYLEVPKSRATTYNVDKMNISETEIKDQAEGGDLVPKLQINNDEMEQNVSMEVTESPMHKKRATTYNRNNMDLSALLDEIKHTTSYNLNNMDVSTTPGSSGFCEQSPTLEKELELNDRRKTFTVNKKRGSLNWHNITDADLLNMIDDESNPCVQDVSSSVPASSEGSSMSRCENAMEDFMNLTINASPLNQSVPFEVKMKQRRESRTRSEVPDYSSMIDNLVSDLKKKDRPKPRLEIDDFLEELKIEPVRIPKEYLNCVENACKKMKDLRQFYAEKDEKRRRLKKEREASQFPQIPTQQFLLQNLIENIEIEAEKKVELTRPVIPPVFPLDVDFEKLLNNKFKTDEHLSKFWKLNTVFLYKGRFKLTHNKMPMFTMNFICEQYLSKADESTIPIIFRNVMLYMDPLFRKDWPWNKRNCLVKNEFYRVINGVDNFTSKCSHYNQLFSFLDYYHASVMKANEIVDNFFNIIDKHKAVYKVHHIHNHDMVRKRCFLSDDIVDIEFTVDGFLDDISINHLTIDAHEYNYTLKPRQSTRETKGLMLVERVLFDTENFLRANTTRVEIEEISY